MSEEKELDFVKIQEALEKKIAESGKENPDGEMYENPGEPKRQKEQGKPEVSEEQMSQEKPDDPEESQEKEGLEREFYKDWQRQSKKSNIYTEGDDQDDDFEYEEKERNGTAFFKRAGNLLAAFFSCLYRGGRKLWTYRKKKWVQLSAVALVVLGALFGVTQVVKYWTYDTYTVQNAMSEEDTMAASYCKVGDMILKYSLDGAYLLDADGKTIWSGNYTMNAPTVDSCKETVLIYDAQGTNLRVYQEKGEIANISTDMPIIKAKVAKQGVTAAILESGENTWIHYYDTKGKLIASFKTTLDSPGYPLDLALSEDGLLMAVSYLQVTGGIPETEVGFYNWSSIGQNRMDNMVSSDKLEHVIAPQVEYLDADTCLVLRDNGFSVYEGKQIPKIQVTVELNQEIISAFYNESYVGFVVGSDDGEHAFTMKVYNLKGREVITEDFDFSYDQIVMDENQILMFNRTQMCTYSLEGVKKFEGDIKEGILNNLLPLSSNQYMVVTEDGTCTIKLK